MAWCARPCCFDFGGHVFLQTRDADKTVLALPHERVSWARVNDVMYNSWSYQLVVKRGQCR